MARKKNFKSNKQELRLFTPESINDLEDIGEILQTYESSIIVNFANSKGNKDTINKAINFIIQNFNTSYMTIKSKKAYKKNLYFNFYTKRIYLKINLV